MLLDNSNMGFYSILNAFLYKDEIPFKNLMISGHGLDDKGIKISKDLKIMLRRKINGRLSS